MNLSALIKALADAPERAAPTLTPELEQTGFKVAPVEGWPVEDPDTVIEMYSIDGSHLIDHMGNLVLERIAFYRPFDLNRLSDGWKNYFGGWPDVAPTVEVEYLTNQLGNVKARPATDIGWGVSKDPDETVKIWRVKPTPVPTAETETEATAEASEPAAATEAA